MVKLLLACCMALIPGAALAQVDVSWNDCVNGTAGTASFGKTLDCAITGNRNYDLHFQYKSPVSVPSLVAVTGYADIGPWAAPLSPFWHFESGGCNGGAVKGAQILGVIPASCADAGYLETWDGGPSGTFAIAAYLADFQVPGRGRFVLLGARGDAYPVSAGDNMWAFTLRFNNRNRASCAGCGEQKCLVLNVMRLESNDGNPAIDLMGADKGSETVGFNGMPAFACVGDAIEAATWGRLKSIFR